MLTTLLDVLGAVLLALGLTLATVGLYGLIRMRQLEHQLHAAALISGPAAVAILLAAVASRSVAVLTTAVLVILFLSLTTPLSSHAIARAAERLRAAGEEEDEDREDD